MRRAPIALLLAAAAALDGCSCDPVPSRAVTDCKQGAVVQGIVKTDILLVVDDSGSMKPHQDNLKANLQTFIDRLNAQAVANDFQVGVVTTSVSAFDGTLYAPGPGVGGAFVGPVLSSGSPTLLTDFQSQVAVGTGGSGKEQPLRAMKLALSSPLTDAGQPNAGFLRPGARLAVIILTDEDDNSESSAEGAAVANTNSKTHDDAGDGVDYKGTAEDPVGGYATFLQDPIAGEDRRVVLGVIAGVDPQTKLPTCAYQVGGQVNNWGCGSPVNDACSAATCGIQQVTNPASGSNLTQDVYCCGGSTSSCDPALTCAAYDKPDRLLALLAPANFAADRVVLGSMCDASFAGTLELVADRLISQTVPISGEPADPSMLVVRVTKADGRVVACSPGTDYTYAAASGSSSASITFLETGDCLLGPGDKIQIDVICAG